MARLFLFASLTVGIASLLYGLCVRDTWMMVVGCAAIAVAAIMVDLAKNQGTD